MRLFPLAVNSPLWYTMTSVIPSFSYISKPWGTNVLHVNLPPCCHISLSCIMGFDIKKTTHQNIQTTCSHALGLLTLCYSILSHATLILYYHACMYVC